MNMNLFNFAVYASGELFGHPAHHAVLDISGHDVDVTYVVMFSPDGFVWSSVTVMDWTEARKESM